LEEVKKGEDEAITKVIFHVAQIAIWKRSGGFC
jgi:hypothetical protein